jgi:hypothetical protein
MSEDANKKGEREFQKEMLKIQLLNDGINSIMTAFIALAISWLVLSVGIFFSVSVPSDVKVGFATSIDRLCTNHLS